VALPQYQIQHSKGGAVHSPLIQCNIWQQRFRSYVDFSMFYSSYVSTIKSDAKNALLLDLFAKLVKESLNKMIYMASMADLVSHTIH